MTLFSVPSAQICSGSYPSDLEVERQQTSKPESAYQDQGAEAVFEHTTVKEKFTKATYTKETTTIRMSSKGSSGGNSGKGYDVTSSGNNSQVPTLSIQPNPNLPPSPIPHLIS